VVKKNSR